MRAAGKLWGGTKHDQTTRPTASYYYAVEKDSTVLIRTYQPTNQQPASMYQ